MKAKTYTNFSISRENIIIFIEFILFLHSLKKESIFIEIRHVKIIKLAKKK